MKHIRNYSAIIKEAREFNQLNELVGEYDKEKGLGHNVTKLVSQIKEKLDILIKEDKFNY